MLPTVPFRSLEAIGKAQYQAFVKEVLEDGTRSIHEPLKKNSLTIFKEKNFRGKLAYKAKSQGNDLSLFAQLYVAVQHREGDMNEFFEHETCPFTPFLTDVEKINFGKKADLFKCLTASDANVEQQPPSTFDCTIFDGPAIVHALSPNTATKTIDDYAKHVFVPFIQQHLRNNVRVDVVWDQYLDKSLKEHTRDKRGHGTRCKFS